MAAEAVLDRHIVITPGVAGGKPHIADHRITVQNVVIWHERIGLSADEIAAEYGLALSDVYAALAYYYDHRAEIDEAIRKMRISFGCTPAESPMLASRTPINRPPLAML